MQTAMFGLSRPLFNADALLENVKSLIVKAREAGNPVVFVQHCGGENSPFHKGTPGWNIHPSIKPGNDDIFVEKNFSDSFQATDLDAILKEMKADHLVICGLVTEGCVDTTLRRAYSLDYKIEVGSDCHSTTDSNILTAGQIIKHHNEVFKIFADVKEEKEIQFKL